MAGGGDEEQQEQERPVSPITLPVEGAAADDIEALRLAVERMAVESAARDAELDLLRQENKELRYCVKPWEPTINPSIPPRAVVIVKSPERSPVRAAVLAPEDDNRDREE